MTRNEIVRCAFVVATVYVAWRIITPVVNDVWAIVITVLAELINVAVVVYVFLVTADGGGHRTPSAVRDRIAEKIAQQRARLPK